MEFHLARKEGYIQVLSVAALHHLWALVIIIQEQESETSLESWAASIYGPSWGRSEKQQSEILIVFQL